MPPTSGLVALMFGTRWLTMLFGFAFFSHQVGGFLGVWLGGVLFEATGSYDLVWWLSVFFGVASAVINLPIVEKPVARPVAGRAQHDRDARRELAHAGRHPDLRLPDRHDRLRPALDASAFSSRRCPRPTAGAATCSRSRWRLQMLLWGAASRSPARSPTASARSGC